MGKRVKHTLVILVSKSFPRHTGCQNPWDLAAQDNFEETDRERPDREW